MSRRMARMAEVDEPEELPGWCYTIWVTARPLWGGRSATQLSRPNLHGLNLRGGPGRIGPWWRWPARPLLLGYERVR